jgi:hypothetical protein
MNSMTCKVQLSQFTFGSMMFCVYVGGVGAAPLGLGCKKRLSARTGKTAGISVTALFALPVSVLPSGPMPLDGSTFPLAS